MNKKDIQAEPIFGSEEQKAKGFCETSWVMISASSSESTSVFYFNPDVDPEEYEDFNHFVEANMDEFYCEGDNVTKTKSIKDNFATISGYDGSMEEDFDEESGKSWQAPVGTAAIMEFHKGGVNQEKLKELIKTVHKDLDDLVSQGAYEAGDSYQYHKDPYKYHGVSRKDFF
jgi:hypothetical protein